MWFFELAPDLVSMFECSSELVHALKHVKPYSSAYHRCPGFLGMISTMLQAARSRKDLVFCVMLGDRGVLFLARTASAHV
jgi:hypothetical protein